MDWRTIFGIVFPFLLLCIAAFTIYRTYKAVLQHNSKEEELRKAAQRNIRMQNLTAMVLRNTHSFFWKRQNGIFETSDAFKEYMNWDGDFSTFASLFDIEPLYLEKLTEFFTTETPGHYTVQVYGGRKGRESHWYELRMQVEQAEDGVVQNGVTIMIDDRKAREAMQLETHRMLLNAEESEAFISTVNHEIRTPLNAIVGLSQIFTDPEIILTEQEVKDFAKEIDSNNTLLMKMINDMLTVTLMDNSNIGFSFEDVQMKDFANTLRRISREDSFKARKVNIEVVEGPEEAAARMDVTQMERVVKDLVDNATKFSKEGSNVILSWHIDTNEVVLTVKDAGIGIEPMYHELIFHRFFKINQFTPGTGLGLALAKQILEKMDATIGVDSQLGKGSTFWIRMKNIGTATTSNAYPDNTERKEVNHG